MTQPIRPGTPLLEFEAQAKELAAAGEADSREAARDVIAGRHGFPDWSALEGHVTLLGQEGLAACRPFVLETSYYEDRARGLLSVHVTGLRRALWTIQDHHPRFADASEEEVRKATLTREDALLVLAREHGCATWEDFVERIETLAVGRREEPFRLAFVAIEQDDPKALETVLDKHPPLLNARGTNGNTLLQLATYFKNLEIVKHLLERGADPNLPNNKGWTPLHQAASRAPKLELMQLLIDQGASVRMMAYGDGGTPLAVSLFHAYREAAEYLAGHAVVPDNLRIAAGLGRLEAIEGFFNDDGSLKDHAGLHREFHRIHSGYPPWIPSDAPQEILDEAFVYAAANARIQALELLLDRGANIDGVPYHRSALHWAAIWGNLEVTRVLLARGADPNLGQNRGGGKGATPLHFAASGDDEEIVGLLLENGADVNRRDPEHHASPIEWARYCGQGKIEEMLASDPTRLDLRNAVACGEIDRVRELLCDDPDRCEPPDRPGVLIRIAAHRGFFEIVRLLLDAGADPNLSNEEGKTALDWALANGHEDVARFLIERGGREGERG